MWRDVAASRLPAARLTTPLRFRGFEMDAAAVAAVLARAPHESLRGAAPALLSLPLPRGGSRTFRVVESPVMAPALAAKYPQIRTYAATAADGSGTTGRLQMDPRGFRAQLFTPEGTVYIDPVSRGDARFYQAYLRQDLAPRSRPADAVLPRAAAGKGFDAGSGLIGAASKGVTSGTELVTYRLALAANGEYSKFHDQGGLGGLPRKEVVLAELVNVTNRVTGVYEREVAVRLELIANNDLLIFQNELADPYKNDDPTSMVASNTAVIDAIVTPLAYDIGHVATTGGGGVAFLGVVCFEPLKGGGVTGLPEPVGDGYYIDFVAHEIGHQFGGEHTFNGSTGNCAGNGGSGVAYEPGSGVTIMAYAGICPPQDLAPHSIDVFHGASYDQIVEYKTHSDGASCGTRTASGNRAPVVTADGNGLTVPAGGFTIPKQTPFELTGSATDPDGDPLTYQWEQFDLGPEGHPNDAATVEGTPPLFRSFLPTSSPTRTFPQLSDLVNDTQTMGEILPAVSRTMTFRLTVRDNKVAPSAGGVASDDFQLKVTKDAGPFRITHPHQQTRYVAGAALNVAWDVANTDKAPVSCPTVDILLSTDGGQSFPAVLADDTANDGEASVTLPDIVTDTALLKVKCANNLFFALSRENFLIGLQPPVLSVAGYEGPDTNGAYTLNVARPATAVGPDTIQESASCGPVWTDDASETLVAGENSKFKGSAQWITRNNPTDDSPAYYIAATSSQNELLEMKQGVDIPAGAVSKLTFRTTQGIEDAYDQVAVRVALDDGPFTTIATWTGPEGAFLPGDVFEGTRTVDLSMYAGHRVRIAFRMRTDELPGGVHDGWYVDDIAITATVFGDRATVAQPRLDVRGQPVGDYCYRARTVHSIGGQAGISPWSGIVDVAVAQTNLLPTARLAASVATAAAGAPIGFNAAASTDADGDALVSYAFDFGDGSQLTQASAQASHAYASAGTYLATVTVTDARGAVSDASSAVQVVVTDAAPSPDPFAFVTRTGVATSVFVTSETRAMSGYSGSLPVSVDAGAQYRIDSGPWVSTPGQVAAGSVLAVRHVSADQPATAKVSTVTVGGFSTEFRSVTADADRTPDAFGFQTQTGVPRGAVIESNVVTPTGFNAPVSVTVSAGAEYRIAGGAWTSAPGSLGVGQTLQTRHTSSATALGYTKTSVKLGTVTGTFTTRAQ